MNQGGIKEIPRFNKNKIENFLKEKENFIPGLKLEFRSLKTKLFYPDIYFTLKKSENKHYSPLDYFLDLYFSK